MPHDSGEVISPTAMEETFRYRLDIYYLSALGYIVTLIAYSVITGTLAEDGALELVVQDPIVILLAAVSIVALGALALTALANRRVVVAEKELRFLTRWHTRTFRPAEIAWVSIRTERTVRGSRPYRSIRIKRIDRRRLLRLRPSGFERSADLVRAIAEWARTNGVEVRRRRRRGTKRG